MKIVVNKNQGQVLRQSSGQVMLLTTLVMSGTILAAIAVAGIVMLYQIRASANAEQSAKAVFAADTGAEFELYKLIRFNDHPQVCSHAAPILTNGASYSAETILEPSTDPAKPNVRINSNGQAGKTFRSFGLSLGQYVTHIPCQ